jgi:transcriptional regulator
MQEERVNNTVLSNQQMKVVLLQHGYDMDTNDIADELDIEPSTVRTIRRKAQVKMNKTQRTVELMDELGIESH